MPSVMIKYECRAPAAGHHTALTRLPGLAAAKMAGYPRQKCAPFTRRSV